MRLVVKESLSFVSILILDNLTVDFTCADVSNCNWSSNCLTILSDYNESLRITCLSVESIFNYVETFITLILLK